MDRVDQFALTEPLYLATMMILKCEIYNVTQTLLSFYVPVFLLV